MVLGTASYMAPEQLDGAKAGPAADVYALAAVAYEAVSGRKALAGETPMEIARKVVSGPPPDLRQAWPGAPEEAAEAIRRAMAYRPEDRPSSAGEFATLLQRGLRGAGQISAGATTAAAAGAASDHPPEVTPPPSAPAERPSAEGPSAERPSVEHAPAERPLHARAAPGRRTYRRERHAPPWLPTAAGALALVALALLLFGVLGGGDDDKGGAAPEKAARSDREGERTRGGGTGDSDEPDAARDPDAPGSVPATGASGGGAGTSSGTGGGAVAGSGGGDPAALNSRGFELMNQGRYAEAIPLLEKAVAAYPEGSKDLTYAYALYNLGKSLRLAGRPKEAVPILEKRLAIPNQTGTVRRELEAARRAAG